MELVTGICSCDDHLDLRAVPTDLWASRLSQSDAELGPHVVERDGVSVWMCEDRVLGGSGNPRDSALLKSLSAIGRAGIEDDGYRAGRPDLRLQDMDRDGLAASVIYGPLALGLPIDDPGLQDRCYAAWNDWAVEDFNAVAPDRLCVLAFVPSHSPEAAVAELERCAQLGHRGAIVDIFGMDIGDRAWDPLWAAAASAGIPLSFHLKGGSWSGLSYRMGEWQSAAFATVLPLQLDEPLATMLFSGALERHPDLTLVLAESGVGWLPYFLARADLEWASLRDKIAEMPVTLPSELFRRQVMATFEEDALVTDLIPRLGADSCMWASDYPHTDSTFPNSRRVIDETLGALTDDDRRKVTVTNCAQLYGFATGVTITGFDHVSLPLRDADAMAAFYRALGLPVDETEHLVVVHLGDQMINFHRAEMWTRDDFTLRAPAATPPCGDVCVVWGGSPDDLHAALRTADAQIEEGPVSRRGGRGVDATSVYTRDPDGNLLEFMIYP